MRPRFWTITGSPFWCDWAIGVGLIAIGWAIYSPADRTAIVIDAILSSLGSIVLLAALVHFTGRRFGWWRGEDENTKPTT